MTDHLSDACLLERFVNGREEAAFSTLVRRHAPSVRAACLRILRSEHDAEDVAQATFLMLAMKAGEVPWRESIGGWLCGVARKLSLNARAGALRRSRYESLVGVVGGSGRRTAAGDPIDEVAGRELRRALDRELGRLPEKYRAPVLLCDVEGLTHEEAARRLGLPSGSMSRRLGRGRALLRRRLSGYELSVAVVVLLAAVLGVRVVEREYHQGAFIPSAWHVAAEHRPAPDVERLIARISEALADPPRAEALAAAGASVDLVPRSIGPDAYDDLRSSALTLADASRIGDGPTLLAAARRVQDACVQCHLAVRQ